MFLWAQLLRWAAWEARLFDAMRSFIVRIMKFVLDEKHGTDNGAEAASDSLSPMTDAALGKEIKSLRKAFRNNEMDLDGDQD